MIIPNILNRSITIFLKTKPLYQNQMDKLESLKSFFRQYDSVSVAFSGGMDSSLVAKVAYEVLKERAVAYTINSQFIPKKELSDAKKTARKLGIKHRIINLNLTGDILNNPANRCYLCKKKVFSEIPGDVVDGTTADDDPSRPGLAAIKELGVRSPLKVCKITKKEVYEISKKLGLREKPSNSCLATRMPTGIMIKRKMLDTVEGAEDSLEKFGFSDFRLRHHGKSALFEHKQPKLLNQNKECVIKMIKDFGFEKIEFKKR